MTEISRDEFNATMARMFTKIDSNNDKLSDTILELSVSVGKMETKISGIVIPRIPDRPCIFFDEHIRAHKNNIDSWKKPIIVGCVAILFMLIQEPIKALFAHLFNKGIL